jgi:hypothetical protein
MFFLSTLPIEHVEKNSFVGIANPETSGLEQLALVFEQFLLLQHVLLRCVVRFWSKPFLPSIYLWPSRPPLTGHNTMPS